MKASEVLNRYANGERNFRNANLRGQSFKGRDLSGADFSGADIRSANFTNAKLVETNFSGAKAGLQRRWLAGQLAIILMVSVLSGVLSGYAGIFTAYFLINPKYITALGIPTLMVLAVLLVTIIRHGFIVETFGTLATTVSITFALGLVLAFTFSGVAAGAFVLVIISAIVGVIIIAFASAFAGNNFGKIALPVTSILALASAATFSIKQVFVNLTPTAITLAMLIVVAILLLGNYMALCTFQSDRKYLLIRKLSITFNASGGTRYYKADLTGTNFTEAVLKSTSFRAANLTYTCWKEAQSLDRARVGDSLLSSSAVRDLLISHNGYKKSYVRANLREADLTGVNLNLANLQWADLSEAILQRADLREANLRETLALGTDFRNAAFTGACLEAWNIDDKTQLEDIDCQHVYLLRSQQERRPSSGDFAPGEFTKLFQEVLTTVDLIFRNGVDWKAFLVAFQQVRVENEDIELAVQSIEDKDDGVIVVRVKVPPEADKAKVHSSIIHNYEILAARLEEKQQYITFLEGTINQLAGRSVTVEVNTKAESKAMNNSNDQGRNVNVDGNMNLSGSTLNLGEISGSVTNTINQLQTASPNNAQLADLLKQLQTAIETETSLSAEDKQEALEQVSTLAQAGANPQEASAKKSANTAVKILKGTVAALPDAAKLAEAFSKLLPAIIALLGL